MGIDFGDRIVFSGVLRIEKVDVGVLRDFLICSNESGVFSDGLSDEDAVEGVLVDERELIELRDVVFFDGEIGERGERDDF